MFAAATPIDTLAVIDPCNRTGKITIPMSYVTETKGVTDFIKCGGVPPPDTKDLSLCLLFQKGRCNAGARCNQVHATPAFVEGLRARAMATSTCCARHGEVHSVGLDATRIVAVTSPEGETCHYQLTDFAVTPSLETAMQRARGIIRVQGSRICRLHQKGGCKFGRDCKNVHLCRDAVVLSPPVATGPAVQQQQQHAAPAAPSTQALSAVAPAVVATRGHTLPAPPPCAQPPALGFAFRALDTSARPDDELAKPIAGGDSRRVLRADTDARWCPRNAVGPAAASATAEYVSAAMGCVKPLSILSIMEEFSTVCHHDDSDPLDLADVDSSVSSGPDFDAFVDVLVHLKQEPVASPQWLTA